MSIAEKIKNSFKELSNVYSLSILGMLLALRIILGYFANYTMAMFGNTIKIHVNFLPILVAGVLFGPVCAGILGASGDILSFFLNSGGQSYFPGFTINGFLTGMIFGLFLYKNQDKILKIILAWLTNSILIEILLSALWFNILYGQTYLFYLGTRSISEVIKAIPTVLLMISFTKITNKLKLPNRKK